ncbi:MAG: SUMF1/EgtB/PvdO family nonheme iron enzyme [Nitrospira sp.]|nr:SUMF1/EgtB/PvdO family nonheme iron enzyme [Nitrospira sp.]
MMKNLFRWIYREFFNRYLHGYFRLMVTMAAFVFAFQLVSGFTLDAEAADTDGMVLVKASKFKFGDEEEGTAELIDLKAYHIDINEVTNARYKKFDPDHKFPSGKTDHPVANVSWHSADTYCKSIDKRLPTEEEWEKAARGTDGRYYPWGDDFEEGFLNSSEGGKNDTAPVDSYVKGKSPFGLNDMAGNVREWTADWHNMDNKIYKVIRGGGFKDGEDDVYAFSVKKSIPEDVRAFVGFRCAK